ncbi:MAG: hypothetical protein GX139_11665 [Armatimonadetes bacterium]|nr:hypothetical protein [Armatimonadota bacterium]
MEVLFSIITLIGMGYAAFIGIRWMARAGHASQNKDQPLTPTDMKVLEQSVARLVADLKAAADECVARVEFTLNEAEHRIAAMQAGRPASTPQPAECAPSVQTELAGNNTALFTPQSGMTTGEIELVKGLQSIAK